MGKGDIKTKKSKLISKIFDSKNNKKKNPIKKIITSISLFNTLVVTFCCILDLIKAKVVLATEVGNTPFSLKIHIKNLG